MNTELEVKEKILVFKEAQRKREKQFAEWQDQIERLNMAIKQTKVEHDFCRGEIHALEELFSTPSKTEPEAKDEKS